MDILPRLVLTFALILLVKDTYGVGFERGSGSSKSKVNSFNFILNSGDESCFYQYYPSGVTVMLEYKIISSTYQDHIIGFQLSDTHGRPLISEFKKPSSWSQFKTTDAGGYRFCFDNTHTRFSKKSVSLRLKELTGTNDWDRVNLSDLAPEGDYGVQVDEIGGFIDRVRVNLNSIQESQETYRHIELRDRQTAENNFDRVNWYSFVCLFCTMSVMLIQVISLRSFFDDKSAVQRFFNRRR